jgi:ABC-type transporter lipoprotein component MlaA
VQNRWTAGTYEDLWDDVDNLRDNVEAHVADFEAHKDKTAEDEVHGLKPNRVVLFEGTWTPSMQITLPENVYNFSFVLCYWSAAPIAPVVVPIIPGSTFFRGMGGYIADSGNLATNTVIATIDAGGAKLTLIKAASLVHNAEGNHAATNDRTPSLLVGIR